MLDAPPLRQAGRLQRVDEAPPPRDLHVMGIVVDDDIVVDMGRRTLLGCCVCAACRWRELLLMRLLLWAGAPLGCSVCAACVSSVGVCIGAMKA